ncbi:uncharacterized protein LOC134303720 [Trichomycterus rosablanca]|uniref:uncharacterized protein LOC134303720 n=1 Tax=Trichomycterus rosablanca TaxID=2290929 RepID=UPI002F35303B
MAARLLLLVCWVCAVRTSVVFQTPEMVSVSAGDSFLLKCRREIRLNYCYASTSWYKMNPRTGKLSLVVKGQDGTADDGEKTCTKTFSNVSVQDSGTYYCVVFSNTIVLVGNGSRVVVTERGPLNPSIVTYTPLEVDGTTVLLQAAVMNVVPTQVDVFWIIDEEKRSGWTESGWMGNQDSASEFTRAQIRISAEEWSGAAHVQCVVAWDGRNVSKTLERKHGDSMCSGLLFGVGGVGIVTAAAIAIVILCLYKDKREATRARRHRDAQHRQGIRDTLKPGADKCSTKTEVEYSCLNPDTFNRKPTAPPLRELD